MRISQTHPRPPVLSSSAILPVDNQCQFADIDHCRIVALGRWCHRRGSPAARPRRGGGAAAMRLAIDYGTVVTRAVLAWPDGRWVQLLLDGSEQLPSGVYVDADWGLWAGQAALARGAADPAGLVAHPKQHLGQPHIQIRGRDVDVLELDRKSTRLNSSHVRISYAVFCLKKKNKKYLIIFFATKKKKPNKNQQL